MAVISGGTTLINNGALDSGVATGKLILLSTATASNSSSLSFTSSVLTSTYDSYVIKFLNIHPASDSQNMRFNLSTDNGSNYNVNKVQCHFRAYHDEAGSGQAVAYDSGLSSQGDTGYLDFTQSISSDSDHSFSGFMNLFRPSSTTFVKHYNFHVIRNNSANYVGDDYTSGYGNTTTAVNNIDFKFASGNIESGIMKLYGVA